MRTRGDFVAKLIAASDSVERNDGALTDESRAIGFHWMSEPGAVKRLTAIDGLRAIAVLLVLAQHCQLFGNTVGSRGVDLFFVISGFCLSLPFMTGGTNVDLRRFFVARAWRILPSYWVALSILALLTLAGTTTTGVRPDSLSFVRDATLLPMLSSPYNGVFWTLGIEARWYLAFPLLIALFRYSRAAFAAVGLGLYAAYLYHAVPGVPDVGTLPCFMFGIVAADLYLHRRLNPVAVSVTTAAVVAGVVLLDAHTQDHGDPLWHIAAFVVVLAALGPAAKLLSWKPLVFIGRASYSIYLVHLPVLLLLVYSLPHFPGLVTVSMVLSLDTGIAFWFVVERTLTRSNFERLFAKRGGKASTSPTLLPVPREQS